MKQSTRPLRRALTAITIAALAVAIGAVFGAAGSGQAATKTAPSEKNPPTISGTPQQGRTLTADHGDWNGSQPINYAYGWQRCNATGGSCAGISGANARLYDLKGQDVGHTLRVRVVAKNADGSAADTSAPTSVIAPATSPPPPPAPTGCPAGSGVINITNLSAPANLAIDGFTSSPAVLGRHVGNLSVRVHVTACGGRPVQGALIYAAAVPFNQFTVAPEVQSGADGWSTINEPQLGGYPVSGVQQQLTVFLRARKSGEAQGQGVSTSRLVAFPVNLHQ
jgi:hypothetical protein